LAGAFELLAFRPGSEKSSIAETALRYSLCWMMKKKKKEEKKKKGFSWWDSGTDSGGRGRRKKFPATLCARNESQ